MYCWVVFFMFLLKYCKILLLSVLMYFDLLFEKILFILNLIIFLCLCLFFNLFVLIVCGLKFVILK